MRGARREKPGEITLPKRRNACPQSSAYTGRHLLKNGDNQRSVQKFATDLRTPFPY